MPPIIHIEGERGKSLSPQNLSYDYPKYGDRELDLRVGSALHTKILSNVMQRAQVSYDTIKNRHPEWRKIDQTLTAYIPADDEEEKVQTLDPRKPVSIVIPYSFATLETLLTYLVTAFLELPYFKYSGVTSDDTIGAILLEKTIELQTLRFKVGLALHTMFRDGLVYGFGVGVPTWTSKYGRIRSGGNLVQDVIFEGNRLNSIDPYLYLPDPNLPIHEVQDGEFVGWFEMSNYMSLLNLEVARPEQYFNVRYMQGQDGRSTTLVGQGGRTSDKKNMPSRWSNQIRNVTNPVDIIYMYITLIPNDPEWELGSKDVPEKWLFGVAGDQVVILAQPVDLDHDMYPTCVFAPDYDGYSLAPISRLELMYGMQHTIDFMVNSHTANVRKAINDMLIVDPYLINMKDLREPGPGKLVRTRRAAWGRGVENAVKQLNVTDVTKNNIQDVVFMIDLMQRTSAAVDSLMGIMRPSGERRSATEARDARMSAFSRLAKIAKIASLMTMYDMGYLFASQTKQFMSKDVHVTTLGRFQQELEEEYGIEKGMLVTPKDIDINYDITVHDGTVEIGEHVETWTQLFQILATQPSISQGFDMIRIFKHIARKMGAKNVDDFIQKGGQAKIRVASEQEIANEAGKGNLKPLPGGRPAGIGMGMEE